MPNGSVMQMRHVLLTEEEANTIHEWFSAATDSLSNWKMPQERVTNLSNSLYKMYYKEGGSLPPDVYIDKMHRYANGGARQTARASLPSEAKHTMPRSRALKEQQEADQSDAESDTE